MKEDRVVLCGANSYERKFYLNTDFETLPDSIKNELKIMCVLYTEDVGGIITLVYEETGELSFEVTHEDDDFFFDDSMVNADVYGSGEGSVDGDIPTDDEATEADFQ